MPLIPFPNVPALPGVPLLPRAITAPIAQIPALAIGIGVLQNVLGAALQQPSQWGIFDATTGALLGGTAVSSNALLSALESLILGPGPQQTTVGFDFLRENAISDFPIEEGSFASYNKVQKPANPVITLSFEGNVSDRSNFIQALETACNSTQLYNIATPEFVWLDYSLERYTFRRSATKGANLLVFEISVKEIREVTAAFFTVTPTPITSPANPASASEVSGGLTQPQPPPQSTLKVGLSKLGIN